MLVLLIAVNKNPTPSGFISTYNFIWLKYVQILSLNRRNKYLLIFIYLTIWLLTHCGRVTHICVGNLTIIGSDNGLSPGRRQAIIWTNAGILLIGPLGTNFNEISIGIYTFLFRKMYFKMSSAKCRPFCLGLNMLMGAISYLCKKKRWRSLMWILFSVLFVP